MSHEYRVVAPPSRLGARWTSDMPEGGDDVEDLTDEQKVALRDSCRQDLREDWPHTRPEIIEAALDLIMPSLYETARTLTVDQTLAARIGDVVGGMLEGETTYEYRVVARHPLVTKDVLIEGGLTDEYLARVSLGGHRRRAERRETNYQDFRLLRREVGEWEDVDGP